MDIDVDVKVILNLNPCRYMVISILFHIYICIYIYNNVSDPGVSQGFARLPASVALPATSQIGVLCDSYPRALCAESYTR